MSKELRREFDRIAALSTPDQQAPHDAWLLARLPVCNRVLDIGCGMGASTRLIAGRANAVLGIDFSEAMTAGARAASYGYPNIAYQCTDLLEAPLEDASFDCVISIATLHHMPLTEALPKIRRVLIAGGMFLAMDLLQPKSWSDHICSALAFGLRRANALVSPGLQRSPQLEEAWRAHGNRESYLTISEARKIFTNALPNAQVKRHLFWRYSVIWKKPVRADHGA